MESLEQGDIGDLRGYPGRGIVIYRYADDGWRWIHFVTGRNPSSQDRVLRWNGRTLDVAPGDASARHDELRHYECAVQVPATGDVVIGNGDHVVQLAAALDTRTRLESALAEIDPEPDPPVHTPRIAAVLGADHATLIAVARSGEATHRAILAVRTRDGNAAVLHTYSGTAEQPAGTAPRFTLADGSTDLPERIWHTLDPALRVLLAAGSTASPKPDLVLARS